MIFNNIILNYDDKNTLHQGKEYTGAKREMLPNVMETLMWNLMVHVAISYHSFC